MESRYANTNPNKLKPLDEPNLKPAYHGDTCGVQAASPAGHPYSAPTLRDQAEKQVGYHRQEADKHDRAAAFFRENPAFDEFIQLLRSGAIQF